MPAPSAVQTITNIQLICNGSSIFDSTVEGFTIIPPRFTVSGKLYSLADATYDISNQKYIFTVKAM